MKNELVKLAKNNVKKKRAFQIILTTYACVSIVLFIISLQYQGSIPGVKFWINFPTVVFLAVLAIIYVSMFGFKPIQDALQDGDTDLEDEIIRLYDRNTENLQLKEGLNLEDQSEILELEELKEKVLRRND